MSIILVILNIVVAALFGFIFYLETLATQSSKTGQTFSLSPETLAHPTVQNLLKNQGVYNLAIAFGLVYAIFASNPLEISRLLHCFIVFVAAYGAYSAKPNILLKQGGLSILFLILSFLI